MSKRIETDVCIRTSFTNIKVKQLKSVNGGVYCCMYLICNIRILQFLNFISLWILAFQDFNHFCREDSNIYWYHKILYISDRASSYNSGR